MRKFKFRLETLGRFRALKEDMAKRDFAAALSRYHAELARLEALHMEEVRAIRGLREVLSVDFRAEEMKMWADRRACLAVDVETQRLVVHRAHLFLEEKREAMTEAMKERKAVDRLREKQRARHDYEMERLEQGFLDEVGASRFIMESGAGRGGASS